MACAIVAATLVALLALWRFRPAAALIGLALVGGAVQEGFVVLPGAMAEPIAEQRQRLERWQERQAVTLSCRVAVSDAAAAPDERRLDAAERRCAGATGRR